jgi:hypothetical protein
MRFLERFELLELNTTHFDENSVDRENGVEIISRASLELPSLSVNLSLSSRRRPFARGVLSTLR